MLFNIEVMEQSQKLWEFNLTQSFNLLSHIFKGGTMMESKDQVQKLGLRKKFS